MKPLFDVLSQIVPQLTGSGSASLRALARHGPPSPTCCAVEPKTDSDVRLFSPENVHVTNGTIKP